MDGGQIRDVCAACVELRVPVVFDFASRFEVAAELVGALPQSRLIMAHLGSPQYERLVDRFIVLAQEMPHVYLDSSYSFVPWKIPEAVERLGPGKVIFGSVGPLIELAKIRVCKLGAQDFERVTWRNLQGLLEERGAGGT